MAVRPIQNRLDPSVRNPFTERIQLQPEAICILTHKLHIYSIARTLPGASEAFLATRLHGLQGWGLCRCLTKIAILRYIIWLYKANLGVS